MCEKEAEGRDAKEKETTVGERSAERAERERERERERGGGSCPRGVNERTSARDQTTKTLHCSTKR